MASPTRAELITQWKNAAKLWDEARKFGHVNASNWIGLEDTLIQSLELDRAGDLLDGVADSRSNLEGIIGSSGIRRLLDPIARGWGKLLDVPETDPGAIWSKRVYDDFITTGDTIKSRSLTQPAVTAVGVPTGNGEILRLNVDANGHVIESQHADTKTLRCIQDANSGVTRNRETFEFRTSDKEIDDILRSGSGISTTLTAQEPTSASIVANQSFDIRSGTDAAPTAISNWTSSVTVNSTNYEFLPSTTAANIYLPIARSTETRRSLKIKSTAKLTQRFDAQQGGLSESVPVFCQLAWNRELGTAGSGTLVLRCGTATASIAVAAQTGWQKLRIAIGTAAWLANFQEQNMDIEIDWTRTAGDLVIDDLWLVAWTRIDGGYWLAIPSTTPWLRADKYSAADTEVGSILQPMLWRGYDDVYLPHSGAPTITDP